MLLPLTALLTSCGPILAAACGPLASFVPSLERAGTYVRSPGKGKIYPQERTRARAAFPLAASSSPLGDLFSGLTGSAPASLEPPVDLLSGTSIDPSSPGVDLGRVYKASEDGWSAVDFHRSVDGRGSALVVALSKSGKRFGGFNPLGWMSTDDYGSSNAAFLWFDKGGGAVKCPILQGGNAAIFDYATGGPNFGAADLIIGAPQAAVMGGFAGPDMEDTSINAGDLRQGSSVLGGAYEFVTGWPARGDFRLVEVEVYCNENIKPAGGSGGGGSGFSFWPF